MYPSYLFVFRFQIVCDENEWKKSFIGFLNNIGQIIGYPLSGLYSDRFGRKTMIVSCTVLSSALALIKTLTDHYSWFALWEFLEAIISSGIYSTTFVLGIEIMPENVRVIGSVVISSSYTMGACLIGLVMWVCRDWRILLQALYVPGLFFVLYSWFLPESIRWLFTRGRVDEACRMVNEMAAENKWEIPRKIEEELNNLLLSSEGKEGKTDKVEPIKPEGANDSIGRLCRSKWLMFQVFNCSICWVTCSLVFYGLAVNSVFVAGNKYLNFILIALAEIPGYVISCLMLKWMGRHTVISTMLLLSGVSCFAYSLIPASQAIIRLACVFVGKTSVTVAFTTLYIISSEIFPTTKRSFLLNVSATIGRIGSLTAPLTPMMAQYIEPTNLFGIVAVYTGIQSLFFPDTRLSPMPDTIADAERMGKLGNLKLLSGKKRERDPS